MTTELLPCPFCGGQGLHNADPDGDRTVGCENCPVDVFVGMTCEPACTEEYAAELWNRRVLSTPQDIGDAEVDQLTAELTEIISAQQDGINVLVHANGLVRKLHDSASARGQQSEQLRVQLAGCLCAAEGATNDPAKQGDYGWSLPYQKTIELHQQLRERDAEIERLKENTLGSIGQSLALSRQEIQSLQSQIATLTADNAALLRQWNELDTRNEQRHHEWTEQLLALTADKAEVVELLKTAWSMVPAFKALVEFQRDPANGCSDAVQRDAIRICEIVEWK